MNVGGVYTAGTMKTAIAALALAAALSVPAALAAAGSVTITSPASVSVKQNTLLSWTWAASGVSAVDVYLVDGAKWRTFAKSYPNTGNFSWAAGLAYTEWDIEAVRPGGYSIAVCPAGARKGDASCGTFAFSLWGDAPSIKVTAPKGGKSLRAGAEVKVAFAGGQAGDEYEVALRNSLVKGGPEDTPLATYVAPKNGKQALTVQLPADTSAGKYTLAVTQKTDGGEPCANVCAQAESKTVRVR